MNPSPSATVVISTKNRADDLRKTVESALQQTAAPEVLVLDDGSTDSTASLIRTQFPQANYHRFEESAGYIVRRNQGAELASGPVIFSIDDDAIFSTPRIVEQTLANFDHPRIGAVAIPFINVNQDNRILQAVPSTTGTHISASYIGTAHALRRDLFLKLGGYRSQLIHQGEEVDYCVRMLDAGFVVRLGRADPIHHFESPRRDWSRVEPLGRRNDVLYAWHNVPMPYLPAHLLGTTFNGIKAGMKVHRPWRMIKGILRGYGAIMSREWRQRRPISPQTYRLSRMLKKRGSVPLEQIEAFLNERAA
ncbi:MAG TPA: glycosyltransferase family A protein [Tepidisphaeraceae bacterium]|jgi:glycosyltransferase involved in cell wall biosynthesis|nr:glycosyltransferase family A protein [Tepidisphaeraceae bacterium]